MRYILVFVLLVQFQCKWAKDRAAYRKQVKTHNKRLVWSGARPAGCPDEYIIQSFHEKRGSFFFSASSGSCTLLFEFFENEKEVLFSRKTIISLEGKALLNDEVNPVKIKDIGWGNRYTWSKKFDSNQFSFTLYSKYGIDDHFYLTN